MTTTQIIYLASIVIAFILGWMTHGFLQNVINKLNAFNFIRSMHFLLIANGLRMIEPGKIEPYEWPDAQVQAAKEFIKKANYEKQ